MSSTADAARKNLPSRAARAEAADVQTRIAGKSPSVIQSILWPHAAVSDVFLDAAAVSAILILALQQPRTVAAELPDRLHRRAINIGVFPVAVLRTHDIRSTDVSARENDVGQPGEVRVAQNGVAAR